MIDLITSTANHHVKYLRSLLRSRKDRHSERRFVVEGVRLVGEALNFATPSLLLYVPEQLASTERGQQLLDQIPQLPNAFATTPAILAGLSDVETPQGIIAVVPMPQFTNQSASLILMLDGVQDPGNVGTVLRSAEAAGVGQVLCLQGTADVWSPKVVRSGMGVHFRLPIVDGLSWETALPLVEHCQQRFAAVQDSTLAYDQADLNQPTLLIIGNEANGVSATTLSYASTITIPMLGSLESLNAAVAGSVLLFEAARQRRKIMKDEG